MVPAFDLIFAQESIRTSSQKKSLIIAVQTIVTKDQEQTQTWQRNYTLYPSSMI